MAGLRGARGLAGADLAAVGFAFDALVVDLELVDERDEACPVDGFEVDPLADAFAAGLAAADDLAAGLVVFDADAFAAALAGAGFAAAVPFETVLDVAFDARGFVAFGFAAVFGTSSATLAGDDLIGDTAVTAFAAADPPALIAPPTRVAA